MINRHDSWREVLKEIENCGDKRIQDDKVAFVNLPDDIKMQQDTYAQQLVSYLRTYTKGTLNLKTTKTPKENICELLREVIQKGLNRNKNRLINLKATVLSPARANKATDLSKILTEWKHTQALIKQEERSYQLDDDTLITLLFRIMLKDLAKEMREKDRRTHI